MNSDQPIGVEGAGEIIPPPITPRVEFEKQQANLIFLDLSHQSLVHCLLLR